MELNEKSYKKGLSEKESFLISSLARQDKAIFTLNDVRETARGDAKKIVHRLAKKKWILPLKRGLYSIVPLDVGVRGSDSFIIHNFVIGSHLIELYYIGYWSALNYHGLSEQIPITTFVATTRAKKSLEILGTTYQFVKVTKTKMFGTVEIEIEGKKVRVSDVEKTLVDCLERPQHCGGAEEIARAIYFNHREVDFRKLKAYAKQMGNVSIMKRLGYILEATDLIEGYSFVFKGVELSKGYPSLDPVSPRKGSYNGRWKILINKEIDPKRWMY